MDKLFSIPDRNALPGFRFGIILAVIVVCAVAAYFLINSYIHDVDAHAVDHCHTDLAHIARYGHSHCTAGVSHILNIWSK